jgi:hypothetical protein
LKKSAVLLELVTDTRLINTKMFLNSLETTCTCGKNNPFSKARTSLMCKIAFILKTEGILLIYEARG